MSFKKNGRFICRVIPGIYLRGEDKVHQVRVELFRIYLYDLDDAIWIKCVEYDRC